MKIPLNDPIWGRLYGAYGVQSANEDLLKLQSCWDEDVASNLFWEKLHHQEDLYPVTYAALPWLWDMQPEDAEQNFDRLRFLSHVVFCSIPSPHAMVPSGAFRGLALTHAKHAHAWLSEEQRLMPEDEPTLAALETWFRANRPAMAKACLNAAKNADTHTAIYLCAGSLALGKSENLRYALSLWQNGEIYSDILDEAPPHQNDVPATRSLLAHLGGNHTDLAEFLQSWMSETGTAFSDHPDQLKLL